MCIDDTPLFLSVWLSLSFCSPGWPAVACGALSSVGQGSVQLACCCGNAWHHLSPESAACLPVQTAAQGAEGECTDTKTQIYRPDEKPTWMSFWKTLMYRSAGLHATLAPYFCWRLCYKQPCWCRHNVYTRTSSLRLLTFKAETLMLLKVPPLQ